MPRLFDTQVAAQYLGTSPSTLNKWRVSGMGPRFLKVGSRVRYDPAELDRWLATRERRCTADVVA
jgi:predicted DNA-binding transcriptional regulator AlpA